MDLPCHWDVENYADRGGCYPTRLKAEVDYNAAVLNNWAKATSSPGLLHRCRPFFLIMACTTDVILLDIAIVFQIWSPLTGNQGFAGGFEPIRNEEMFWMNNNLFHGLFRKRVIQSKTCVTISRPSGQNRPILPDRDFPRFGPATEKLSWPFGPFCDTL